MINHAFSHLLIHCFIILIMWSSQTSYAADTGRPEALAALRCSFLGLRDDKETLFQQGLVSQ